MERLVDIDIDDATKYTPEIEEAFDAIHGSGVAHYNISPSNVLLNHEQFITIIDFGRAGYIGEEVPSHKRKGIKSTEKAVFSVDSDKRALRETIGMFSSPMDELFRVSPCLEIFAWKGCLT